MKRIVGFLLMITVITQAGAQTFRKRFVTPLEEKLSGIEAGWVSMNPDTLLDFVITGVAADGQLKIIPYQNLSTASYFVRKTTQLTGMKSGNVQMADWNRDNKMDLVISGKTAINTDAIFYFTNMGGFLFQKQSQKLLDHSGRFVIADLDNDALPDIVTFGDQVIRVYGNSGTALTQRLEITGITPTDISVFDMNVNGVNDLVVTGRDQQNKPVTSLFLGAPGFKYTRKNASAGFDGALSLADMNEDSLFDAAIAGSQNTVIFINKDDSLVVDTSLDGLTKPAIFTGDMTSDGKSDQLLSGKQVNFIYELDGTQTKLDTTGLILQRMGDQDRDGDLDLIQVIDSAGSQWLKFYENTSPVKNKRPERPTASFAISTFDKTFIIWEPSNDDHTPIPSITYDIWLGNNQTTVIPPTCDVETVRRTAVRHGNAGTNKSMVIGGLLDERYFYGIQAVDNAYNGSYEMGKGGVIPCFDLVHEDVQACKGKEVKLTGGGGATWYSMSKGLLGKFDTLKFVASVNDTIFAFVPQQLDCSKNKVFVLHVNEAPPSGQQTIYACKGKTIKLEIASGWKEIIWNTNPPQKNVSSIGHLVNEAVTITATATSQGCIYKKDFIIKISVPIVTISGDGFQLLKGNSVQLEATGNVEIWQWDPPQGLDNSTIPNPVATPSKSTEYVLTGTDSVGCSATAKTHVFVQENAFVPNLFTPNGDGKNDNLMVYGLTTPTRFNFRIFNREGSLVYESKDVSQASGTGWNGFVAGTRQPSGIYYWRIDGEMPNGDKLLLNGKPTGSILLLH
ncbi:MAG TPA: gliding motility-associated C-terminal domain-containing protein [Cyclobacteriaceae bacterium]|nr:gliding motility-associated C-terminal domain-containing protein [Cyclobacteriaceae bacterium]